MVDPSKHYDRLTPDERLRLWIAADARGDRKEGDRLLEACPRHDYRMRDYAFTERADRLIHIVLAVTYALDEAHARLSVMAKAHDVVCILAKCGELSCNDAYADGYAAGMAAAKGKAAPKSAMADVDAYANTIFERAEQSLDGATCKAMRISATGIRSILEAFDAWSRDTLGSSGADVLRAMTAYDVLAWMEYDPAEDAVPNPLKDKHAAARAVFEAEPDPEIVADWRGGIDELWADALNRAA